MVFNNSILLGAAGQGGAGAFNTTLIPNSVWLDGSADGLTAPSSTFSAQDGKEFTLGTWFQLTEFGVSGALFCAGANPYTSLRHNSDNKIYFQTEAGTHILSTTNLFRDIGWYHILVSVDTTQSVTSNRVKIYINGVETTLTGTYPAVNHAYDFNTGVVHEVGDSYENGAFEGYLAQSFMIGSKSIQQGDFAITDFLDTFTFGTNGSQFIPKAHTDIKTLVDAGSSNSFLLQYENSSALGTDSSTNTNTFTATSMSSANQSSNTPSLSYPLLNPLSAAFSTPLSNGNTIASGSSGNGDDINPGIIIPKTGKWVWQITNTTDADLIYGVRNFSDMKAADYSYTNLYGFYSHTGDLVQGASPSGSYLDPASGGDVYQIYYNAETRKMWVSDNGTIPNSGDPDGGTNEAFTIPDSGFDLCPTALVGGTSPNSTFDFGMDGVSLHANGQTFKPLTSKNLPTPDYQGIDYFDATLYEGNGTGQRVGDFVPFTDAYAVTNSVMFEDGDSRSLTLNSSATRTSATVAAFSLWTKRANLGTNQRPLTVQVDSSNYFSIYYNTSDQLDFTINNGGATILQRITNRAFKDNSAWHNIVVIINQGESTQADRVKVFYDGVQIPNDSTGFGTNTCTLDGSSALNFLDSASAVHDVGGGSSTGFTQTYDGYVSEVAFLDGADSGAKLNASDFGQVDTSTNRWVPKDIGSYNFGNTGYYLEFKVAPGTGNGAGTDTSGESNNFTSNGSWATTDQFTDTPSKNYPIFSPKNIGSATATLTEGNLKFTSADNGGFPITMQPTSGKWYFEVELDTAGAYYPGLFTAAGLSYTSTSAWAQTSSFVYLPNNANGAVYNGSTVVNGYNTGAMSNGDRLAIAWDVDNRLIYYGLASGGSTTFFSSGNPAAGTGAAPFDLPNERLYFGVVSGGTSAVATHHFISSGWEGAAPTGFSELNQDNLDDIASKITAWSWIKNRDATDNHMLFDRVRGIGEDLHSNSTAAEATNANTVQRFLQRGVQVGNDAEVNTANESYVLWQWLLGDSATTGSTNSDGSVDTTVIAADTGHFSVVKGTTGGSGATFGHGLGAAPDLIINKDLNNSSSNWLVYNSIDGASFYLVLNSGGSINGPGSTVFGTEPTSTVFTLGSFFANVECINYCFRSVPGVCKVGTYTGNGNSNGTYISTGFKPKWVMVKWTGGGGLSSEGWLIKDTARQIINPNDDAELYANFTTAETAGATHGADILSDGFKLRGNGGANNQSGATYLYLAMADIGGNGTLPPIYGR